MRMQKKIGIVLCAMLVGYLGACSAAFGVEKPTTTQKTCVTGECHADYGEKTHVHGPVGLGNCQACHTEDSAAEHTYSFAREGKDLCEYCHLDQAAKKHVHEPLKDGNCLDCHDPHSSDSEFLVKADSVAELCETCHQVTANMKFLHGPTAVGQCSICHSPHSSDYPRLLTMSMSELCVSCHIVTKDELEKFEFVHEPVKGDCVGCHDPHGAGNAKMVKDFAPFLCYKCHKDIQKVAENSEYQHSIVSDFDGCNHCHTPHASTVPFLLKEDSASLCMSCHDKPQGISQDEVLPAFTDELKDKKYLHGPVADKDCSGCHTAHGSKYFKLLAKEYPPVFYAPFDEKNYELCFGCHPKTLVEVEKTEDLTDFRNGDLNLHYTHVHKERRGRTCRACHETHASNLPKHIRKSVPYGAWELPVGFSKTSTGGSCKSGCHVVKQYDRENAVDNSDSSS